ncbi:MAG: hypothetical protein GX321_09670 [Clostridiales bacterium]|nr:hypothetical protein [Clostridiales bacterium]
MKTQVSKYLFLIVQLILYGLFLVLDFLGSNITLSSRIKFLVVVLCFLYVVYGKNEGGRQRKILTYAMAFTVISDIYLLFTDDYFNGLVTFVITQQLYGVRIKQLYNRESTNNQKNPLKSFAIRVTMQIVASVILSVLLWQMGIILNSLLVASMVYVVSLVTNVVGSIRLSISFPKRKDVRLFTIGLILFFLCDINVGLFNMSSFIDVGSVYKYIYNISSILMWTFYAPSQVMIALSKDIN